jgi:hypothetical protein
MDCIQAQSLVSEAMDRQPIAPALLAEAKEHCRTCPECAVFVRAQLAARNAPLPTPPAGLADRVMAQVRAEAAEKAAAIAAAEEQEREAQAAAEEAANAPVPPPVSLAPRPVRKRQLPRMWVSAAAAAAVVLALLGTGAVVIFGMKAMSGVAPTESPKVTAGQSPTYGGETSESAPLAADSARVATATAGPQFITVNGTVYSWSRVDDTNVATLSKLGVTTTSLGGKGQTISRTVYVGRSPETVYVVDDEDVVQAFSRLTRDYHGQTYVLVSPELTGYGQWPTLPAEFTPPTSPEGLPTFVPGATDSAGVQTYKPAVATGISGIAIAPSTDTGLMKNNPNWTWWIPVR